MIYFIDILIISLTLFLASLSRWNCHQKFYIFIKNKSYYNCNIDRKGDKYNKLYKIKSLNNIDR